MLVIKHYQGAALPLHASAQCAVKAPLFKVIHDAGHVGGKGQELQRRKSLHFGAQAADNGRKVAHARAQGVHVAGGGLLQGSAQKVLIDVHCQGLGLWGSVCAHAVSVAEGALPLPPPLAVAGALARLWAGLGGKELKNAGGGRDSAPLVAQAQPGGRTNAPLLVLCAPLVVALVEAA